MSIFAKVWNCLTGSTWRSEALEVVNSTYTEEKVLSLKHELAMARAGAWDARHDKEVLWLALLEAVPCAHEREFALEVGERLCDPFFGEESDEAWQEAAAYAADLFGPAED